MCQRLLVRDRQVAKVTYIGGIRLAINARRQHKGIRTLARGRDKEYALLPACDLKRLHPRFMRFAKWFCINEWIVNSNDCDDIACEFCRYIRRCYKKGQVAVAVCVVYSADHAALGWFREEDDLVAVEPMTGEVIEGFDIIEAELI